MDECRLLTKDDFEIIPQYIDLFQKVLGELSPFYKSSEIQKYRKDYCEEYIQEKILNDPQKGFAAHFANRSIDGLLMEERDERTEKRTWVTWLMTSKKNYGIGNELMQNCITRAKQNNQENVSLGVSVGNVDARRFSDRLGFKFRERFNEDTMDYMEYSLKK